MKPFRKSRRHGNRARTPEEQARFDAIKAGPCMAALQRGIDLSGQGLVEVHHLLSGSVRRGHMATVGLSIWSHRGVPFDGLSHAEMRETYGPALSEGSKPFREAFGNDEDLLALQASVMSADGIA